MPPPPPTVTSHPTPHPTAHPTPLYTTADLRAVERLAAAAIAHEHGLPLMERAGRAAAALAIAATTVVFSLWPRRDWALPPSGAPFAWDAGSRILREGRV